MATTIARLAATISADGTGFMKGINTVMKNSQDMGKRLKSDATKAMTDRANEAEKAAKKQAAAEKKAAEESAAWRVSIAKKAAAAIVNATVAGSLEVVADLKKARDIGETVNGLRTVEQGIRDFNGDVTQAAAALTTLGQKIADANNGGMTTGETFKRLGVNARSLADTKPSDALRVVADRFKNITNPAERAALAYQLFGDQAGAMLPLLIQGSEGIDRAARRMKAFGGAVSDEDAANLETVKILWDNLIGSWTMATQLAIGLLPIITAVIGEMKEMTASSFTIADGVKVAVYVIGGFIATYREFLNAAKLLGMTVIASLFHAAAGISRVITILLQQAARLPDKLGGKMFREAAQHMQGYTDVLAASAREAALEVQNIWDSFGNGFRDLDGFMDNVLRKAQEIGTAANAARSAAGAIPQLNRNRDLFGEAASLASEVASPLQKFEERMSKLKAMVAAGAISWDTYARAASRAVDELEEANQLSNLSMPQALKANTAEAVSAINQARTREDFRNRETPIDRVRRVAEQSLEIEKQQLTIQQRTADAATRQRIARF